MTMAVASSPVSIYSILSLLHNKDTNFNEKLDSVWAAVEALLQPHAVASSAPRVLQHLKTSLWDWCLQSAAASETQKYSVVVLEALWGSIASLAADEQVRPVHICLIRHSGQAPWPFTQPATWPSRNLKVGSRAVLMRLGGRCGSRPAQTPHLGRGRRQGKH